MNEARGYVANPILKAAELAVTLENLFQRFPQVVRDTYQEVNDAVALLEDYVEGSGNMIDLTNSVQELIQGQDFSQFDIAKIVQGSELACTFFFSNYG